MTELHPDGDLLVALALDDVAEPERDSMLQHLSGCSACRSEYDALSSTIERTLAASPAVGPDPGFDRRVLDAMGFVRDAHPPVRRIARSRLSRWQLVAASVVLGLGVGAGATYALAHDTGAGRTVTASGNSSFLTTAAGRNVGTVTRAYGSRGPALVVTVAGGRTGMTYQCRVRLADGRSVAVGNWTVTSPGGDTWVADAPAGNAVAVDMVANSGAGPVWSSARL